MMPSSLRLGKVGSGATDQVQQHNREDECDRQTQHNNRITVKKEEFRKCQFISLVHKGKHKQSTYMTKPMLSSV